MLALFVAAAAASTSPVLESSIPWWERITVTADDQGKRQNCQYEASFSQSGAEACDEKMAASMPTAEGQSGTFSKLTVERRFSPGGELDSGDIRPGDTLLGRQVMYLTFDDKGAIASCDVVAATGEMAFQYDCDAARKEQFRAQAGNSAASSQAFLTILAYAHSENIA